MGRRESAGEDEKEEDPQKGPSDCECAHLSRGWGFEIRVTRFDVRV